MPTEKDTWDLTQMFENTENKKICEKMFRQIE